MLLLLLAGGVTALVVSRGKSTSKGPTSAANHPVGPLPAAQARSSFAANGPDKTGLPLHDGDWRLDSVTVTSDAVNNFTASANITYTASGSPNGPVAFNLTLLVNSKQVGTLIGSSGTSFTGGQTTVQFLSVNATKRVPGPYTYQFKIAG